MEQAKPIQGINWSARSLRLIAIGLVASGLAVTFVALQTVVRTETEWLAIVIIIVSAHFAALLGIVVGILFDLANERPKLV